MVVEQQLNGGNGNTAGVQEACQQEQLNGANGNTVGVQEVCQQRKQSSKDSITLYAVRCRKCLKWRTIPTKEEYETIRESFNKDPWFCGRSPERSCEQPEDIQYDTSRVWVMDKPAIPKPPPGTERLVIMRGDMSKMDTYYLMPNGKRARRRDDVERFLEENPEFRATLPVSRFSFLTPKIVRETVSESSVWRTARACERERLVELDMADPDHSRDSSRKDN